MILPQWQVKGANVYEPMLQLAAHVPIIHMHFVSKYSKIRALCHMDIH